MDTFSSRLIALSVVLGLAGGLSVNAAAQGRPDLVRQSLDAGAAYVPGEMLVQFRADASDAEKSSALRRLGGMRAEVLRVAGRAHRGGDLERIRFPAAVMIDGALEALESDEAVEFAEPNWIYRHEATSNDTLFTAGSLWGMYGDASIPANAWGSQAAEAWAAGHTCSSESYVGVIDEGVMDTHEDLEANMWVNPFDPVDGVDNDGNGFVDDVHGWDFDGGNNTIFDGLNDDHGTHVAGTIAGVGGNGKGVAGVCWNARIINGKFLGRRGGTTANAIRAVDYMTDLKSRHGIDIVALNNSWGGGGYSQGLYDAIARADDAGILFVVAAGNAARNNDTSPSYPSSYDIPNVISVAAITSTGTLAAYSNYGAASVDLGAPGSGIYSTVPSRSRLTRSIVSSYASFSGTSMATPHVTGAALLYKSTHPGATHLQIRSAILGSVVSTPSLGGKTVTGGRLNVSGF